MGKTYWMLVTDQANFDITRKNGFTVQGVDTRNRRKAVRMAPDDRVLYYIKDRRGFGAVATVTSDYFEQHSRIWKHYRPDEDFPHRVELAPDVVLEPEDYVDALEIAPTLDYLKKWAPERWELAFFGMLHIVPQRDFSLLEDEMRRSYEAARGRAPRQEAPKPAASAAASRRRQKRKAQATRRRKRTRARATAR
jgi:predicted RNA-binding protein